MGLLDKIERKVKRKLIKKTAREKAKSLFSEEKARELVADVVEDEETDAGDGKTGDPESTDENGETEEDSWLEKKAQEADEYLEDDDGPVTSLDDMERKIEETKKKAEDAGDDSEN